MKKPQLITALALAGVLTTAGVGVGYAATTETDLPEPMANLVTAIAEKFDLNEADVAAVFAEQHSVMEAERDQLYADRLAEAVTAGDLTQEQADLLLAKRDELEANKPDRTTLEDLSPEERHDQMKDQRAELTQWAEDNGIPEEYLPLGPGGKGHPGMGHRGKMMRDGAGEFNQKLN